MQQIFFIELDQKIISHELARLTTVTCSAPEWPTFIYIKQKISYNMRNEFRQVFLQDTASGLFSVI